MNNDTDKDDNNNDNNNNNYRTSCRVGGYVMHVPHDKNVMTKAGNVVYFWTVNHISLNGL